MQRIQQLFERRQEQILNIYFTAGYPGLHDTEKIILSLEEAGVDLIEVGMPYSDPLADGPVIQQSGQKALKNGMTLPLLFEQIQGLKRQRNIPLILMGYFNQVMQYGERAFFRKCREVGIDGLILPDLPLSVYEKEYQNLVESENLGISFLITPQTPEARIRKADSLSRGFIYMVSNAATTGATGPFSDLQMDYFEKIKAMDLRNKRLIGFGISNHEAFMAACRYAHGAIIGSAFIKALSDTAKTPEQVIPEFIEGIRNEKFRVKEMEILNGVTD